MIWENARFKEPSYEAGKKRRTRFKQLIERNLFSHNWCFSGAQADDPNAKGT